MELKIKTQNGLQPLNTFLNSEWSIDIPLEQGGYLGSSGELVTQDNSSYALPIRIRAAGAFIFVNPGTYETIIHSSNSLIQSITSRNNLIYNSTSGYGYQMKHIEDKTWNDDTHIITVTEPCYLKVLLRKSDNSTITVDEVGGYVTIKKIK